MTQELTPTERKVAIWLARGKATGTISSELAISPGTLRVHLSRIRAKTGIASLDPVKLARTLETGKHAIRVNLALSDAQAAVLKLFAQGRSYDQIAAELKTTVGTAMNHASQGCKRLGITATGKRKREALQAHFATPQNVPDWRKNREY